MAEEFVVELKDEVSAGAKSASSSVLRLAQDMLGLSDAASKDLANSFGSMQSQLSALAPVAIGAAGALAAVGVAIGALVVKGAALAIEASEAREKLEASFGALLGGREAAAEMISSLDGLRGSLGLTRGELATMSQQLLSMGVPASELEGHLKALASIKAIGLPGGVEAYTKVLAKLSEGVKLSTKDLLALRATGVNVDQVAAQLGAHGIKDLEAQLKSGKITAQQFKDTLQKMVTEKGADALATQANSLSAAIGIAKENITLLFEEIGKTAGYKAFVAGVQSVLHVFDQSTASGKALKALLTTAFNGIFAVAAKVFPYIRAAILGLVIAALKIYTALKPAIAQLQQLFSSGDNKSVDTVEQLAEGIGKLAPIIASAAGSFVNLVRGLMAAYERGKAVWDMITGAFEAGVATLKGLLGGAGSEAGGSLIDGLIGGIQSKTGAVYSALKSMAAGAIDTLKGALQISSPSKVMLEMGKHTAHGMAAGIEHGSDAVADAAGGMADAATAAPTSASSGRSGGGQEITINIGGIHIDGGAKGAEELTEEAWSLMMERIALSQGLPA